MRSSGQWRYSFTHSLREISCLYAKSKNQCGWEVPSDSAKAADAEQALSAALRQQHHEAAATLSPQSHTSHPLSAANSWELRSFAHNIAETQLHKTCSFVSCGDPWILLPFFFLYGRWKALSDPTEGENLGCSLLQNKDINWCQIRRWQHINFTHKPPWVVTTPQRLRQSKTTLCFGTNYLRRDLNKCSCNPSN